MDFAKINSIPAALYEGGKYVGLQKYQTEGY
jgi:hypothetical protein